LVHREKLARFAATWNLRANLTYAGAECLAFAVACREATNRRRRSSSSRGGDRDRSGQDEDEDEGAPPLASLRRCAAGARAASAGGAGVVVPEDEEAGEMCAATLRSLPRGGGKDRGGRAVRGVRGETRGGVRGDAAARGGGVRGVRRESERGGVGGGARGGVRTANQPLFETDLLIGETRVRSEYQYHRRFHHDW
jgi:hypothetical protein